MPPSYTKLELSVGAFVVAGALAIGYLSLTLGRLSIGGTDRYPVQARFSSVGSLKKGDPVKIAGVSVGEVARIRLADFTAEAELELDRDVRLPDDTIASIETAGLLGDAYVSLAPGASDKSLSEGQRILRTEPAISLTELISRYAFGAPLSGPAAGGSAEPAATKSEGSSAPGAEPTPSPFEDPLQ